MAGKTWTLQIDGKPHQVSVDHSFWTGARTISVDGQVIERSRKVFDTGSEHHFEVAGRPCQLRIQSAGMNPVFELLVEGQRQDEAGAAPSGAAPTAGGAEETAIPTRNIVAGIFGLVAFMGLYFRNSRPVDGGAVQIFDYLLIGVGAIGALAALFWPSSKGPAR